VRRVLGHLQLRAADELGHACSGDLDRRRLVVVALDHQRPHVAVLGKKTNLFSRVRRLKGDRHPPILEH
jgi:hypothetical protein